LIIRARHGKEKKKRRKALPGSCLRRTAARIAGGRRKGKGKISDQNSRDQISGIGKKREGRED